MPTIPWNLGPNEIDCVVEVEIHPGERRVMYDANNEGYPGSPAWAEVRDATVIEGGNRRKLTDEEYGWLEEAETEIEEAALAQAD